MIGYSSSAQLEDRVYGASPAGLTLILMERAVESIRTILVSIRENDARCRAREVTLLLDILSELTMSLKNDNSEETKKRRSIYASLQEMLVKAHVAASAETFATVEIALVHLLEGWKAVCRLLETAGEVEPREENEDEEAPAPSCLYLEAMSMQNGSTSRGWMC